MYYKQAGNYINMVEIPIMFMTHIRNTTPLFIKGDYRDKSNIY
jgi:hypothetical protein